MDQSIRTRVDTQPPPERVPVWVIVLSFSILIGFFVVIGFGLYNLKDKQLSVGSPAPDFTLVSYDGESFDKDRLSGKIVILHFWASWCTPCENEAALIESVWRTVNYRDDILFLGIGHADTEDEALAFLQRNEISYPNGADKQTKIADAFNIRGVPETIILDQEGNIAYIQIGPFLSSDILLNIVKSLY